MSRVAVIGWDCAPPALVFERWRKELPHIDSLMTAGLWGELQSCHPPITVPAWAVMTTGRDPGELGIYGFRNRRNHGYEPYAIANSLSVREDAVWDILAREGKRALLVGIPPSYPPRPIEGCLVSCFLTPSTASSFTHPPALSQEVNRIAGGYVFDVDDFRSAPREHLLTRIGEKTRKHFRVVKHLLTTQPWDFFMTVEMGPDRVHHAFWRYIDPSHPAYEPDGEIERRVRQYYRDLDAELGEVLDIVGDDTTVIVVSDHGAKKIEGTVRFNEWLMRRGYLSLHSRPAEGTPLSADMIDWEQTRAWGDGGYYGRLFLNVRGREPQGQIEPGDYEAVRDELAAEIESMEIGARAHSPAALYRAVRGVPPDLMVYFGDLQWRSIGSVGWAETMMVEEAGLDGANHDWHGVFVMRPGDGSGNGMRLHNLHLMDIAPTILASMGVGQPDEMIGRPVSTGVETRLRDVVAPTAH
jgi:predicted AlkP superfamily phosphohydrolase/phosphomutase